MKRALRFVGRHCKSTTRSNGLRLADPTPELLESLKGFDPGPLPVPNFGYACLNMSLRNLKPPIFTSRRGGNGEGVGNFEGG